MGFRESLSGKSFQCIARLAAPKVNEAAFEMVFPTTRGMKMK